MQKYPLGLYNAKGEIRWVNNAEQQKAALEDGFGEGYRRTEYPKSLHKDGEREGKEITVKSEAEEKAARARGFKTLHEVESKKPQKSEEEVE